MNVKFIFKRLKIFNTETTKLEKKLEVEKKNNKLVHEILYKNLNERELIE